MSPHYPGFMTRGIHDPQRHYYRRLFTDAVRAVDAVRTLPQVDPSRLAAYGRSQGGGISLAVAGLVPGSARCSRTCRSCATTGARPSSSTRSPYAEIARYLRYHRDRVDRVVPDAGLLRRR